MIGSFYILQKNGRCLTIEIEKIDFYNPEGKTRVRIKVLLQKNLKFLHLFLDYLKINEPDIVKDVVDNLISIFGDISSSQSFKVDLENKYQTLKDNPNLFESAVSAILAFLNYSKYKDKPINKITKLLVADFLRPELLTAYYLAKSLTSAMPKGEAIEFYQTFRDYITGFSITSTDKVEKVVDILGLAKAEYTPLKTHNWTLFKIDAGKVGFKSSRCLYQEILKELNDPEFSYAAVCYADFEMVKVFNKNFALTRSQTLVNGDYCDFCYHDTRIDKDVTHPSKEFWEKELA